MRIGILTQYYGSANCGGRLQALALCKVLNRMDLYAEQICYSLEGYKLHQPTLKSRLMKSLPYQWLKRIYRHYKPLPATTGLNPLIKRHMQELYEAWSSQYIPHSANIFTKETISDCVKDYDILITGSDQVWNLNTYSPTFFLAFAPSSVRKIAYAASVCNDAYTEYQQRIVAPHLTDFKAISVREAEAVKVIEKISPVPVEVALDPTLLLDRSDWDEIADGRLVEEPYLFCYYLGNDSTERRLAQEYAAAHRLKIVVMNCVAGIDVPEDREFSDIALNDVTPGGFISLIKHAECVFTDSFHGCVFSSIYHKNLFVFGRAGRASMNTRIRSVAGLFGFEDHFCDTVEKATLGYIDNCDVIDYEKHWQQYEAEKETSLDFLRRNICIGKDTE